MSEAFSALEEDFLKVTSTVVLATVTTVDGNGAPRSRVLHPVWEVVDGRPVGWIFTSRSPVKTKHLAGNPNVAVSYLSAIGEVVLAECVASWVEDGETKKHVYELINGRGDGYDLRLFGIDSPENPAFEVLRLDPSRVQVNTDFPKDFTFIPRMAKL
ncbi:MULTISPECIES: pyridoxamine 5'-phosphate oxidase family protein [Crossiella]|uniref:Putative pyridoxamine 5'-phosphate oxidase family protein n=1 Tax=Crossiella cryophila TaxID=43355 RepID=A0A7W7CBV7_9PSEU|nr:pyridoxamine 5'-phosphate oxidase family protein [Crossiella cryophila]MBB4678296.1 putative pyridoxamine 5'-phosphate oxidase family protein [Crossiella cryophila]